MYSKARKHFFHPDSELCMNLWNNISKNRRILDLFAFVSGTEGWGCRDENPTVPIWICTSMNNLQRKSKRALMNLQKHEQNCHENPTVSMVWICRSMNKIAKKILHCKYEFAEALTKLPRKYYIANMNLQKHEQNCQENTTVQIWICTRVTHFHKFIQCKYEFLHLWTS